MGDVDISVAPTDTRVKLAIEESLDGKSGSISPEAFSRNGKIINKSEGTLSIDAYGSLGPISRETKSEVEYECTVCNGSPSEDFIQAFFQSPFQQSDEYSVPFEDTHEIVDCSFCSGTGMIECQSCRGTGSEDCSTCRGAGYEEVTEKCNVCEGNESSSCQACGGEGQISYRKSCSSCDGTGQEKCRYCSGTGETKCDSCKGDGEMHEYQAQVREIERDFHIEGLPDEWGDSITEFASSISWTEIQSNINEDSISEYVVEAKCDDIIYVTCEYDKSDYRVALSGDESSYRAAWDPATSYPHSSIKRKVKDGFSRILSKFS